MEEDYDLKFERLGKMAFDCEYRRCDPLSIADADEAKYFFRGTLMGKKAMSAIELLLRCPSVSYVKIPQPCTHF